jgi:hypothetical protein
MMCDCAKRCQETADYFYWSLEVNKKPNLPTLCKCWSKVSKVKHKWSLDDSRKAYYAGRTPEGATQIKAPLPDLYNPGAVRQYAHQNGQKFLTRRERTALEKESLRTRFNKWTLEPTPTPTQTPTRSPSPTNG